ncbi:MAG TPA: arylsulfatase [Ramlibacter sp.]|nr:arylsulfatase [Ramlibacter sp.]
MTSDLLAAVPPPGRWPAPVRAPRNAPNILVFLTDDVGFGACSTFGGPIETPVLDDLAAGGLRFNRFHTTAMCSPTRASLLTGRNPHNVAMGMLANRPTCFDGYTSVIPKSAGSVAAALRQGGYATAMFGKSHITPEWESSHAGPFDRWPTGLGFDYFFGFMGFDTNMWAPSLVENTSFIEAPPGEPRHFDELMADRAIQWIRQQHAVAPQRPFFGYYATGTAHAPHHAPADWLARYRGRFDAGWDAMRETTFARQQALGIVPADARLTPRPDGLPAWDSLSAQHKLLAARLMEAYAAALSHADHHVGRLLQALRDLDLLDNTLVLFIQGDNGGSAEGGFNGSLFEQSTINRFDEDLAYAVSRLEDIGGPALYNNYPAGWGWAMNSPFPYYKQVASHFGGTRNGLVASWPRHLGAGGGICSQFHHVADIMPTVLEAAGVAPPTELGGVTQDPLDGISMLYAMTEPAADDRRRRQIFECLENYAMYDDGWYACSRPVYSPWHSVGTRQPIDHAQRVWELYDLRRDFTQADDLAQRHPEQLARLQELFWEQARLHKILPLHSPTVGAEGRPSLNAGRSRFVYRGEVSRIHADAAPVTVGRSFAITACVALAHEGQSGVLASHGGPFGGYAFFLQQGRLAFHYNAIAPVQTTVVSVAPVALGEHELSVIFDIDERVPGAGGTIRLLVDGVERGQGRVERTLRTFMNSEGFNVGVDTVAPVCDAYALADSRFGAGLASVTVEVE